MPECTHKTRVFSAFGDVVCADCLRVLDIEPSANYDYALHAAPQLRKSPRINILGSSLVLPNAAEALPD